MTARTEVLNAIQEADSVTVEESEILDTVQCGQREAKSALEGLYREKILIEQKVWGGPRFYTFADGVTSTDLEQAANRRGPAEIADAIIRDSPFLQDPR